MHVYFLKLDSCSEASLHTKYINNRNKAIIYLYIYICVACIYIYVWVRSTLNSVKGTQIALNIAWQWDAVIFFEKEGFIFLLKIKDKGQLSW